jgi:hypothetical protein
MSAMRGGKLSAVAWTTFLSALAWGVVGLSFWLFWQLTLWGGVL